MSGGDVGLPEALERAASALPGDAEAIRPANGDPAQLAERLDAEAAVRVVGWLLVHEPAAGEELALAWAEEGRGAGAALLSIEAEGLPRPARKVLRRIHHRLRSRGVRVPEPERGSVVATLPPVDDRLEQACVGPLDPRGTRVAFLARDQPSGGVRLFEAVFDDVHGILSFEVYGTGRSRVRRLFRELLQAEERRAAPAPADAVCALIARAAAAHPASRPLPPGFREWRARLLEGVEGVATPGERVRSALTTAAPDDALARASRWVQGGAVGPWPPAPEGLDAIAERIAEAGKGQLVVSDATQREQVERALDEALDAVFDADFAEVTARRFEESAYVMWKTGREEDARVALAAADAFRAGAPRDNPVARAMLEALFAPVLREARGADEEREEGRTLLARP